MTNDLLKLAFNAQRSARFLPAFSPFENRRLPVRVPSYARAIRPTDTIDRTVRGMSGLTITFVSLLSLVSVVSLPESIPTISFYFHLLFPLTLSRWLMAKNRLN